MCSERQKIAFIACKFQICFLQGTVFLTPPMEPYGYSLPVPSLDKGGGKRINFMVLDTWKRMTCNTEQFSVLGKISQVKLSPKRLKKLVSLTTFHRKLDMVEIMLERYPSLLDQTTVYDRLPVLHIVVANGRFGVLSLILDRFANPDILNHHKQISCLQKLIQAGANIFMLGSLYGKTCLHHTTYYRHFDCLQAIFLAAQSSPVANSWRFMRIVNVRDGNGATPLHLAARQRRPNFLKLRQALLCGALQVIIQKLSTSDETKTIILQSADQMMMLFLKVFACRSSTVHEEAMLAIGDLAYTTEAHFENYMKEFHMYLEMVIPN
ncbi:hypothetical protein GIB67_001204 [Kingdonia uniflora]|uniref:Importin subunit beta-1/Transportin-1-like TPR repeats domain-containing protein n=1 Tax=Kingdonia uniflora TaxID=39325 RepID=A0A7J7LGE3_9MAGN|nr:hypothetical protein GIB67_001204 [Kingdonia uniflora]